MSNVVQFFPIGKRLGEAVTLPYNGDIFTANDGTVWKAANNVPLAYSSSYSALLTEAPSLVTSGVVVPGPFGGAIWQNYQVRGIVGATSGGATWLAITSSGSQSPDYYYTSTNAGSTWTQRSTPVAAKAWISLWDGTNFVLYAQATAGTGVQESTDGITWTPRTAISISAIGDFIYAPSITTYLVVSSGGTAAATSTDRTTWTSRTTTTTPSASVGLTPGIGLCTWNAGAGLFIMGTSTGGQYQTSPDGATWTNRSALAVDQAFCNANSLRFASDATTTVAIGHGGVCATSTNGTSWTVQGLIDSGSYGTSNSNPPGILFYDGAKFVCVMGGNTYYSADGATWTRNTYATVPSSGTYMRMPAGFANMPQAGSVPNVVNVTDVTSTTPTNIFYPLVTTPDSITRTYVRIK